MFRNRKNVHVYFIHDLYHQSDSISYIKNEGESETYIFITKQKSIHVLHSFFHSLSIMKMSFIPFLCDLHFVLDNIKIENNRITFPLSIP